MSRSILVDGDSADEDIADEDTADEDSADKDGSFTPPDPSSGDAIRSTVEVRSRRRTIAQAVALLALGAGVWLFVTAGDSSVFGGELGSDDGLSTERAAIARILDGVVAQVEVEAIDASGDQGAEFGAGAGPSGRPPAAPSRIGRDDPTPGGTDLGSGPVAPIGPSADGGELVPAASDGNNTIDGDDTADTDPVSTGGSTSPTGPGASGVAAAPSTTRDSNTGMTTGATARPGTTRSSTTGRPATTRPPTSTASTGSPTVTAAAVTTSPTAATSPSTTAPSTVTTGAVTTGAVTTGAVTTASTTATTAASTTQPESNCVVTVSNNTQYRADHKNNSPVIGQAAPGTYAVLERHGAEWYRVAGGWLRDNKKVTPSGC